VYLKDYQLIELSVLTDTTVGRKIPIQILEVSIGSDTIIDIGKFIVNESLER